MTKITKMYLHGSKENNYEHGANIGLEGEALAKFAYALYEVDLDVEVDMLTGAAKIMAVDGRKLVP